MSAGETASPRAGRERDERGRAQNARPRDVLGRPLPRGAQGVPRVPEDLDLPPQQALVEAQRLLDAGMPFHAHEVLEAVWKAAPAADRDLWQGLAQLAVGLTHHLRGNPPGAAVLLRRGRGRVAPWAAGGPPGTVDGDPGLVDVDGLLDWSGRLLDEVGAREAAGTTTSPVPPASPRLRRPAPTTGDVGAAPGLRLERRALTPDEAAAVVAWRYPSPYDRHDLPADAVADLTHRGADGRDGYEPVLEGDAVVALLCLGVEATVPGQPHRRPGGGTGTGARAETDVLDVGLGVRPDRLGAGVGSFVLQALVRDLRAAPGAPRELRAVARELDGRALGVLARRGMTARSRFEAVAPGPAGEVFVELRGALEDLSA